jgi:hypothetical protein
MKDWMIHDRHKSLRKSSFFIGTWSLGVIFIVAAALKIGGFDSFARQISQYDLMPSKLINAAGILIITVEAIAGTLLLIGAYQLKAIKVVIALLLIFLSITLFKWDLLEGTDCNCFGSAMGGGPASVVWHDVMLLSFAALLIMLGRKQEYDKQSPRTFRAGVGALTVLVLVFFTHQTAMEGLPADSSSEGRQVRVFLKATCIHCIESADQLRELIRAVDLPDVKVFIGAEYEGQIQDFLSRANLNVSYTPLTFSQLSRQVEHVPAVQILYMNKVLREWEGEVPTPEQVRTSFNEDVGMPSEQVSGSFDASNHHAIQ